MALIHMIGKQATIALLFIIVFSATASIAIPTAISDSPTANNGGILPENSDKTLGFSPMAFADRGVVINVNSTSDEVNGDAQNVQSLLANPGPDGISLREAITATNNDPGTYTIRFDPALNGTTIDISSGDLPALAGGNVTINGDIYGNGNRAVTICGVGSGTGFAIASSQNTIYSMRIQNFYKGIYFSPLLGNETFADNIVSNCTIMNTVNGIILNSQLNSDIGFADETDITWVNTQICGNTINSTGNGINLCLTNSKGNNLTSTLILNNTIEGLSGVEGGMGIDLGAGCLPGSVNNRISDALIANNIIHGNPGAGIAITPGSIGGCNNSIDNVRIIDNDISLNGGRDNSGIESDIVPNAGVYVFAGDASSDWYDPNYRPVTYPENNNITNVWVLGNKISGVSYAGVVLQTGCPGANHNTIHNVNIANNTMTDIGTYYGYSFGVKVTGGAWTLAGYNEISDITIQTNVINVTPYTFYPQCGGIAIEGGQESSGQSSCNNIIKNVTITGNDVFDQKDAAILVIGGLGDIDEPSITYNNTVSQVEISFNKLNTRSENLWGNMSRIWVFGGLYWSTDNIVEKVNIAYNLEGSSPGDPLVVQNAGGNTGWGQFVGNTVATDNVINYLSITSVYSVQADQKQFNIDVKTNSSVSDVSFNQVNKALSFSLNVL